MRQSLPWGAVSGSVSMTKAKKKNGELRSANCIDVGASARLPVSTETARLVAAKASTRSRRRSLRMDALQPVEQDDVVDAVEEFRPERRLHRIEHLTAYQLDRFVLVERHQKLRP